jgi:hypothetical protein
MMKKILACAAMLPLALSLAACDPTKVQATLSTIKSDIATAENALSVGTVTFCATLPQLTSDFNLVTSITGIDAKTAADAAAAQAAATVACANPTQNNIAAVLAKIAAAKIAVNAALATTTAPTPTPAK